MQRKDSSAGLSCNGKQARKLPDAGSSGRVGLCHLALKCIANQNSALCKSKESIDWWVTDTSDGNCWNTFFVFLKLEIVRLSSKKNANWQKNRTKLNTLLMSLFYSFYLCYTHIRRLFLFYMGFHTNRFRVYILWGQLRPRAYIYSDRFPKKYISNCACSMHRNDLHDGMFWSELLHELS